MNYKNYFLTALTTVTILYKSGAQSLPLGGISVSGTLCSEGNVYTWGLNKQGGVTGTLGTNSVAQNVSSPMQVNFPDGVKIKYLGEVSGAYFLAIDCNGKAWGWGENGAGQLGTGTKIAHTTPQRVLVQAGSSVDISGYRDPVTGQLQKIKKIAAGNSTSLAITEDGKLLSWGCNSGSCDPAAPGILGNGTLVDAAYPTFVLNGATNQPLENVIDISIGDHLAIALVDENQEGLGMGTVYTWGDGSTGTLGRNVAGTGNSGTELNGSNVARPARLTNISSGPSGDGFLRNIIAIEGGDIAGYALDKDGYVWAWGNGGYGGITGQGSTITHSDPRRVLKGAVTGGGTDGTYLLAKSISAGNGFAMAVTLDGKPVSWGNNSCSTNPAGPAASPNYACGGNLGNNGSGSQQTSPVYIQSSTGLVHSDVKAISKGDFWGYYQRTDNTIWVWGDNIVGQLGIGNYTTQNRAVPFSAIPSCNIVTVAGCTVTSLDENVAENTSMISVYPNPSSDVFTLNIEETVRYRITDFNGRELELTELSATSNIGSSLAPGFYYLHVTGKNYTKSFKIQKLK